MTEQEQKWLSKFGEEYNSRNMYTNEALDEVYISDIGISRTAMNEQFIGNLDRNMKILEVGCNVGIQLINLREMGFKNLYGIELQPNAIKIAHEHYGLSNIVESSAYDIPFKDGFFDLVFTNRVLIHMNPDRVADAIREIYRCSSKYIYGSEYYFDNLTEITGYRDQTDIVWKRNWVNLYKFLFPELNLLKEQRYQYTFNSDVDTTFLFEK